MDPMQQQEYERMLELGSQNQALALQAAMAKELSGAPEMRTAGRVSRAPHPLEYLSALLNKRAQVNANNKQRANSDLQNQMMLAAILRSQQPQQPQQMPPEGPGMQAAPQNLYGQMRPY